MYLHLARIFSSLQESDTVCQDCIKFLTDAQQEAKDNTSFIDSLIENIENQCDLLGPGLSAMVSGGVRHPKHASPPHKL